MFKKRPWKKHKKIFTDFSLVKPKLFPFWIYCGAERERETAQNKKMAAAGALAAPGQLNLTESPYWGSRSVDCFEKLEQIGEGTYGSVQFINLLFFFLVFKGRIFFGYFKFY